MSPKPENYVNYCLVGAKGSIGGTLHDIYTKSQESHYGTRPSVLHENFVLSNELVKVELPQ